MKGANVKNDKVNKEDANIKDSFDDDEGSEAKNKPKVDTKAGGREFCRKGTFQGWTKATQ